MTDKLIIVVISILSSCIIGMMSYWLKTVHKEFKQLLGELTAYTSKLKQLIVGIQMQIEKGIETDIKEMKSDIKNIRERTNKNDAHIAALNLKIRNTK